MTEADIIKSNTATRLGIDNHVAPEHRKNLPRVLALADEIEAVLGKKITVTSGYRCYRLNLAVGGSQTSAHSKCLALDFGVPGMSNLEVCKKLAKGLKDFDQIIFEFGEAGWVHVGLSKEAGRKQKLTASKNTAGKTVYSSGFVA